MDRLKASKILLIGALTIAAVFAIYGGLVGLVRAPLALPFLLVIPGFAWLNCPGNLKVADLAVLSIGLTLAMEIAIGTILLLCGLWSPQAGFGILLAVTGAGLVCTWTCGR